MVNVTLWNLWLAVCYISVSGQYYHYLETHVELKSFRVLLALLWPVVIPTYAFIWIVELVRMRVRHGRTV